jgi:hypothetical protein
MSANMRSVIYIFKYPPLSFAQGIDAPTCRSDVYGIYGQVRFFEKAFNPASRISQYLRQVLR